LLGSFEGQFISVVAGGNFCAGYDLDELAGLDSVEDALPTAEQLENGYGPMVMYYIAT